MRFAHSYSSVPTGCFEAQDGPAIFWRPLDTALVDSLDQTCIGTGLPLGCAHLWTDTSFPERVTDIRFSDAQEGMQARRL